MARKVQTNMEGFTETEEFRVPQLGEFWRGSHFPRTSIPTGIPARWIEEESGDDISSSKSPKVPLLAQGSTEWGGISHD